MNVDTLFISTLAVLSVIFIPIILIATTSFALICFMSLLMANYTTNKIYTHNIILTCIVVIALLEFIRISEKITQKKTIQIIAASITSAIFFKVSKITGDYTAPILQSIILIILLSLSFEITTKIARKNKWCCKKTSKQNITTEPTAIDFNANIKESTKIIKELELN